MTYQTNLAVKAIEISSQYTTILAKNIFQLLQKSLTNLNYTGIIIMLFISNPHLHR